MHTVNRFYKIVAIFLMAIVTALPTAVYADIQSDGDSIAEDSSLSGSQLDSTSEDNQSSLPLGATYDDFIAYAEENLSDMPDPQHMWDVDASNGISLFSTRANNPYWSTCQGRKTFYNGYGEVYSSPAIMVLDVSEHQGSIDWDAVKSSGVDAVILRIGYGVGHIDDCFERNLAEVRRVGLPYGVYLYSYAYDASFATDEARWTAELLNRYGTSGMQLPIYYDLEKWSWTGHTPPTTVGAYESIVSSYVNTLATCGYSDVHVYSYRSYCQSVLNSPAILSRTSWIAEYGSRLNMANPYYSGQCGWQYTSSGSVGGVSGDVDLSAFSGFDYVNVKSLPMVALPDGLSGESNFTYYINSHLKDSSSIQMSGAETGAVTQLHSYSKSANQRFVFTPQDDGSYVITNESSGLALDVQNANPFDGAIVQQYEPNGTDAQRWFLRDSGSGYYIQSALGNWVLDISGANSSDGSAITLYTPNGTDAQKFMTAKPSSISAGKTYEISSALSDNLVFDIPGACSSNGAAIQLYSSNDTDAQLFTFNEVGNGVYELVNVSSGKVVEIPSGATSDCSKIAQYDRNGTLSQHWSFFDNGDGTFIISSVNSGKAIDIPSAVAESGVQLQIYSINGTYAQRWKLTEKKTVRERIDELAYANKDVIPEGEYAISSSVSERQVVDVAGGSAANEANVQIYSSNASGAQRWRVTKDDKGYLTFTNVGSGKVLDVAGGIASSGINVQQYQSNGTYSQKWFAEKNKDGTITLHSALGTGFVLDLAGGSTSNGANVNIYSSNGTSAQKFILHSKDPVNHGNRSIEPGTYVIASPDGKVLDVPGASTSDGTQLQVYTPNGTQAQSFSIDYDEAYGLYVITAFVSGKPLDADNGDIVPGTSVNQWGTGADGSSQRYWELRPVDDGYLIVNGSSGKALGLSDGGRLITVPVDDNRAVTWHLDWSEHLATEHDLERRASSQGVILKDGVYTVQSALSKSKVLDVAAGSIQDGANVQLYSVNGTRAQQWRLLNDGDGFVRIQNIGSGKYLDVCSAGISSGTNVWQYAGNLSQAQRWLPIQRNDGSVILYSALGHGLVLDVSGGSTRDGANVQLYAFNDSDSQHFVFVRQS